MKPARPPAAMRLPELRQLDDLAVVDGGAAAAAHEAPSEDGLDTVGRLAQSRPPRARQESLSVSRVSGAQSKKRSVSWGPQVALGARRGGGSLSFGGPEGGVYESARQEARSGEPSAARSASSGAGAYTDDDEDEDAPRLPGVPSSSGKGAPAAAAAVAVPGTGSGSMRKRAPSLRRLRGRTLGRGRFTVSLKSSRRLRRGSMAPQAMPDDMEGWLTVMAVTTLAVLALGVLLFVLLEPDKSAWDVTYMVSVVVTYTGYGDEVPTTDASRLVMGLYALLAVGCMWCVSFVLTARLLQQAETTDGFFARNHLWICALAVVASVCAYAGVFAAVEDMSWVDAAYFSAVSLAGIGYGDVVAVTTEGQVLAVLLLGLLTMPVFSTCSFVLVDRAFTSAVFPLAHSLSETARRAFGCPVVEPFAYEPESESAATCGGDEETGNGLASRRAAAVAAAAAAEEAGRLAAEEADRAAAAEAAEEAAREAGADGAGTASSGSDSEAEGGPAAQGWAALAAAGGSMAPPPPLPAARSPPGDGGDCGDESGRDRTPGTLGGPSMPPSRHRRTRSHAIPSVTSRGVVSGAAPRGFPGASPAAAGMVRSSSLTRQPPASTGGRGNLRTVSGGTAGSTPVGSGTARRNATLSRFGAPFSRTRTQTQRHSGVDEEAAARLASFKSLAGDAGGAGGAPGDGAAAAEGSDAAKGAAAAAPVPHAPLERRMTVALVAHDFRVFFAMSALIVGAAVALALVVWGADGSASFFDALWLVLQSLACVGYGDVQPQGTGAKVVITLLAPVAIGLQVLAVSHFIDYLRARGISLSRSLKISALGMLAVLAYGVPVFLLAENGASLADAVYWSLITVTTVGFGDVVPGSVAGRLLLMPVFFGIFFFFLGAVSVTQVYSTSVMHCYYRHVKGYGSALLNGEI